jgi:hypothetical protein
VPNRNSSKENTVVAVDAGGTNADMILSVDGKEYCHKLPSTKADPKTNGRAGDTPMAIRRGFTLGLF